MTAKELKASILQLAVTGKLVPQDPNDEPASELLKRISAERARVSSAAAKSGRAARPRAAARDRAEGSCRGDRENVENDIALPKSWQWVRLGEICASITDGDHQPPPQQTHGIPFLVISNVSSGTLDFSSTRFVSEKYFESLSDERKAKRGDLLVSVTGSYGIVVPVETDKPFCFQRHMALLKTINPDNRYLAYCLQSPYVKLYFDSVATGSAQKTVGLTSLKSILIPLPPLAEQERIVAKVEALLPLVEEYGRLEEARRQMDADLPAALERAILQEAIQGRLVPQDPNDEPASELVKRISAERARTPSAAKNGRAARPRAAAPDRAEDFCRGDRENVENDIALPKSWQWVRLGEVSNYGQCKSIEVAGLSPDTWSLDLEEIEKGTGRLLERKTVAEKKSKSSKHVFTKGMVLYSKLRTYLNKVLVADRDGVCTSEIVPIELAGGIDAEYVRLVLMSPYFLGWTASKGYGIKMPRVGTEDMRQSLIPLPPLAEQRRIVAKVEELRSAIRPLAT